jgi:purine-binding chemotaxis protein CheW
MAGDQDQAGKAESMLLMRAGGCICALPVASVGEVMRPLPMEALAGMPEFVRGVAVIRGRATPVLSLAAMLSDEQPAEGERWVVLHTDGHQAALAVDAVPGIQRLEPEQLATASPLLERAHPEATALIGVLDGQLLLVLEAGRIVPETVWEALSDKATEQ